MENNFGSCEEQVYWIEGSQVMRQRVNEFSGETLEMKLSNTHLQFHIYRDNMDDRQYQLGSPAHKFNDRLEKSFGLSLETWVENSAGKKLDFINRHWEKM